MEKERDLISELCTKWGLAYGPEEIEKAIKTASETNGNGKRDIRVSQNHRNIEWNMRDTGILSLTGLRGR